jgi:hypothetical protein
MERPKEPKVVTGLWLADARQQALERAEACPVMTLSGGEEHEVFKGAKEARGYYIKLANDYADRLEAFVEKS